jgi:hypothetical protein
MQGWLKNKAFHFYGLLLIPFLIGISSCRDDRVSTRLERRAKELNELLYADVEEDHTISARIAHHSSESLPSFLKEKFGPFVRESSQMPQTISMLGESYVVSKSSYLHTNGAKFYVSFSDMFGTEALLENRRRRANNAEVFDNDDEKVVVLPFDNERSFGFYHFKKAQQSVSITILLYNRYFIEVNSDYETKIKESDVLAFLLHLPYDELKNP